jgi:hypothetical protein
MAASGADVSAWAQSARNSRFSGSPFGNAEVGLSQEEMILLRDVMLLVPMYKEKKIDRATFLQMRDNYIARLNQLDIALMSRWSGAGSRAIGGRSFYQGQVTLRHRPQAYVPYWSGRKLKLPNEFAITNRLSKSYNTFQRKDGQLGRKGAKHRLFTVLGKTHLAMMGFATRPKSRGSKGSTIWTPGNIRAYQAHQRRNVVSTKAFGWYAGASGKPVPVTARSSSRLAQLAFRMGGTNGLPRFVPNTRFVPYMDKSGAMVNMGTFLNPHVGGSGLQQGEIVRRVAGKNGVSHYLITTMGASVSGAKGIGGGDAFRSQTQIAANTRARERARGGGRVGRSNGSPISSSAMQSLPRVRPVPFQGSSPLSQLQGAESDMDTSGAGVLGTKRPLESEA